MDRHEAEIVNLYSGYKQRALLAEYRLKQAEQERDELRRIIQIAAEQDYEDEVVSPYMEKHIIGPGKEYADKQDWVNTRIAEWTEEARNCKP